MSLPGLLVPCNGLRSASRAGFIAGDHPRAGGARVAARKLVRPAVRLSVHSASYGSGGSGSGLFGWLRAGRLTQSPVLSEDTGAGNEAQLIAAKAAATAPTDQRQQEQQQQDGQHAPAQPHHYAGAWQPAPGHAASSPAPSAGPIRAKASDMLAGLTLEKMREKNQAAQQLQRQRQHLGGPPWGTSPNGSTASAPGTASSSLNGGHGSLWGSTAAPTGTSGAAGTADVPAGIPAAADAGAADPPAADCGSLQAELSPVTSPEAAVAFAAYQRAVEARRTVPVRLRLGLALEQGQSLRVVGGHASLGKWALESALQMRRAEGDTWEATVHLPAGSVTEYKLVVVDSSGRPVVLQAGNNGVLAVGFADERLEVQDSWAGDSTGVTVVVDGDRGAWPASRESRLLSWANELFQQAAGLRHDLRKSRMELVGAQEEARDARLEAARLLGELQEMKGAVAELETARLADRADLAHTRAVNHVLQTQLADTTASLNEAVETAVQLMAGQEDWEWEEEEEEEGGPQREAAAGQ